MKRLALGLALIATPALAQNAVIQNGPTKQGDLSVYSSAPRSIETTSTRRSGQGLGVNPFTILDNGSTGLTFDSAPETSGVFNSFTIEHDSSGNAINACTPTGGTTCKIKYFTAGTAGEFDWIVNNVQILSLTSSGINIVGGHTTNQSASGTIPGTGPHLFNSDTCTDTSIITGDPPLQRSYCDLVLMQTGGAVTGNKSALGAWLNHTVADSASDHDMMAFHPSAYSTKNNTGVGQLYAIGPAAIKAVGHFAGVIGDETDVEIDASANADYRYGKRIVNQGTNTAGTEDAAIVITSTLNSGRFKKLLSLTNEFGFTGLADDGVILSSNSPATVAKVFDLTNISCSGKILDHPDITINCSGAMSTSGGITVTAAGVVVGGGNLDVVAGTVQMAGVTTIDNSRNATLAGITASLPTSAGSGGLYACIDSLGVMYKKSSCP